MTPSPNMSNKWEKEWLGYCRTYLTRYGIIDEVAILAIAGNLEQVVKSLLSSERAEIKKMVEDRFRIKCICHGGGFAKTGNYYVCCIECKGSFQCAINQALTDILSALEK